MSTEGKFEQVMQAEDGSALAIGQLRNSSNAQSIVSAAEPSQADRAKTSSMHTATDVANIARCSAKTVRKAVASGELVGYIIASRLVVWPGDCEAWIASRRVLPVVPRPVPVPVKADYRWT